jgi:hypothetical protein
MRPATDGEIELRDLAIRILDERGIDIGTARGFNDDDRGIEITRFEAPQGARGLTINHRRPTGKAVSVFVIHWGGKNRQTLTLCHVSGSWEEQLKQLAAGRKIETA